MMEVKINKSEWKKVRLGDVATEYSKRINNPSESGLERFVGNSNIGQWDFRIKSWESTSSVSSAMKLFEPNDYLLVRRSLYASDFRERAPRANFSGICSGDILTIRENPEYIANGFLIGILNSPALWKYVVANASGSITRRIKWKDLANYKFLLPPKKQQSHLAELLWSTDVMMDSEALLESSLRDAFEASRNSIFDLQENIHPLNIQKDAEYSLDDLSSFLKEKMLNGIYKSKDFQGRGIRIINMGELFSHPIIRDQEMSLIELSEKETNNFVVEEGDLIFARRSLVVEGAGKCAIVGEHNSPMTFESSMIRVRLDRTKMNPKYVYHFLKSKEGRKRIRRIVGFTTVAGIASTDLAKVKVPYVSIQKQNEIVNALDGFDASFSAISKKIAATRNLKISLINQVF